MPSLVLALLLLQAAAPRAEAERLFALGAELVAEGDTAGAVAAWEGARATGWASTAAEHNLGTVALARGDLGRARLHLERARRLDPFDDAVARNLALTLERLGEAPPGPARSAWDAVVGVVRPGGLVALALALAFGALGLVGVDRRRLALGVGAAAVVAVGAAGAAVWEATRPLGVVLVDDAQVVEAPSPTAPPVARLRAGETVVVGEAEGGWRRVAVGRSEGWALDRAVEAL